MHAVFILMLIVFFSDPKMDPDILTLMSPNNTACLNGPPMIKSLEANDPTTRNSFDIDPKLKITVVKAHCFEVDDQKT